MKITTKLQLSDLETAETSELVELIKNAQSIIDKRGKTITLADAGFANRELKVLERYFVAGYFNKVPLSELQGLTIECGKMSESRINGILQEHGLKPIKTQRTK